MSKMMKCKLFITSIILALMSFALVFVTFNLKDNALTASADQSLSRPNDAITAETATDDNFDSTSFYIQNGAWIRISTSGIKFATIVDPAFHTALTAEGATVTYFATAKVAGGSVEQAKELPFSATRVDDEGNYLLFTYINFDNVELETPEQANAFYAKEFTVSSFAKVVSADQSTTTYYQAYSEANDGEYDIVRSMRAVGNEAYLNWNDSADYQKAEVEKYFTEGNRSSDVTAFALDTDKIIFNMPGYTANATTVTANVGAEKHTATLNQITGMYEILNCDKVATNLSIFTDDGTNTVYSTKMVSAIELNNSTIDNLQTATSGYYVLTEDIDMSGKTWAPTVQFTGTIDGLGHKISNFTSPSAGVSAIIPSGERNMYPGLLCYTGAGATIKNLDVQMVTNGIRGGLIGQIWGATNVENVNIVCDKLDTSAYGGTIANVVQGTLTVKDTNIIIKATSGNDTYSGFIAGGEANSANVVLSNVVVYNPTTLAATPYNGKNAKSTLGTDGEDAVAGEDYVVYASTDALISAYNSNAFSSEFKSLVVSSKTLNFIGQDEIDEIQTATNGYYLLTEDIDMSGKSWAPSNNTFTGTIDGNGHKITNFASPSSGHMGLIQYSGAGATIKNLDIHLTTNGWKGGLIGQVKGATTIDNVDVVIDSFSTYYGGAIANVIQGTLTVKDTNIIIKSAATSDTAAYSGFIAGGEANSFDIIVSNVVCYNPTGFATTPYSGKNAKSTLGTDGEAAVAGEDYTVYLTKEALIAANEAGKVSDEFVAKTGIFNYISQDNVEDLMSATAGDWILTENVDLSGITWTPTSTFAGTLDGQGFKISNLSGTLFKGINNAKITNLILDNVNANSGKGILCADHLSSNVEFTNVIVQVTSVSGSRASLLGYQTGGTATLKNVVVDMCEFVSDKYYKGFLTTHAANIAILDGAYFIGGNGNFHSTEGTNHATLTGWYYKADGETEAVQNTDYFIYDTVANFTTDNLDAAFKLMVAGFYGK